MNVNGKCQLNFSLWGCPHGQCVHGAQHIVTALRRSVSFLWSEANFSLSSCFAQHPCLPLWGRCPVRTLGGEGMTQCIFPLSHALRRASSPRGRAKDYCPTNCNLTLFKKQSTGKIRCFVSLIKQILDGIKELLALGGLFQRTVQLAQQFLLFFAQMGRCLHHHSEPLAAPAAGVAHLRNALAG